VISLVTVVRNEEARIGKMLDWHQPWVDEVIVVHDGPCEDQTKNIVTQRKCVYYERPYTGYCEPHRAAGTAWSHGDWILFVDADEMFPIQFLQSVREIAKTDQFDGVVLYRKTTWVDAPERAAVQDMQMRFCRKSDVSISPMIHTSPMCKGKVVSFVEVFPIVHKNREADIPEKLERYRGVIEGLLEQDPSNHHLHQCLRDMAQDEQRFGLVRDSSI